MRESIINLCKREYKVDVDAMVAGNTIAVYIPAENLFDAVFNLDTAASKKINDVILGVSRVTLSTDAECDFYIVIAQDPKLPEVEIVYIRYVGDVKRFLLGDISRGEYAKRAVIAIRTPPQAHREKVLKELFSKLNIEGSDEMIKEYLGSQEAASGIRDISYWDRKFYIKEIGLAEFLAAQLEERIKIELRGDKLVGKWYEISSSEGKFTDEPGEGIFIFNVGLTDRAEPFYLDSGLELGGQKKRDEVFKKLYGIIGNTLWAYKFQDFSKVVVSSLGETRKISRDKLWALRQGRTKKDAG